MGFFERPQNGFPLMRPEDTEKPIRVTTQKELGVDDLTHQINNRAHEHKDRYHGDERERELTKLKYELKQIEAVPIMRIYDSHVEIRELSKQRLTDLENDVQFLLTAKTVTEEEMIIAKGKSKKIEFLKKQLPTYELNAEEFLQNNLDEIEPLLERREQIVDKTESLEAGLKKDYDIPIHLN